MFSVIVPVYKSEQYLSGCIDSILGQTCGDFELILVDDGSPDSCPLICDRYADKDPRIKVLHKPNGGLVNARRAGAELARGEFVCFVDGDDFVSCDMLEQYKRALMGGADIVCAGSSEYYDGAESIKRAQKLPSGSYDEAALGRLVYPAMLSCGPFFTFGITPSLCCKCFRASLCREVMGNVPDGISLGDDAAVTYACLLKARRVQVIDYCGYMYRQNPRSITHSYDANLAQRLGALAEYMTKLARSCGGNLMQQLDEYKAYLLILAKNNELRYAPRGGFFAKRSRMMQYLRMPGLKPAWGSIRQASLRQKLVLFCLRYRLVLPVYVYEKFAKR